MFFLNAVLVRRVFFCHFFFSRQLKVISFLLSYSARLFFVSNLYSDTKLL